MNDFDAAIDRDPFAGAPYQARGQSLIALGQYDKAVEDYNAALNVDNRIARRLGGPWPRLREAGRQDQGRRELPARHRPRFEQRRGQRRPEAARQGREHFLSAKTAWSRYSASS